MTNEMKPELKPLTDPLGRTMTPNPECGCHECNPKAAWMILCEHCGNKRCPHAEHHKFKCTRSNDVGQVGVEGPCETTFAPVGIDRTETAANVAAAPAGATPSLTLTQKESDELYESMRQNQARRDQEWGMLNNQVVGAESFVTSSEPPSPDWIKAAAEEIARWLSGDDYGTGDGYSPEAFQEILTRHAPATAAKEGKSTEQDARALAFADRILETLQSKDAEIARLKGELLKANKDNEQMTLQLDAAKEVAESVRGSFFGISSGNLKAIVWHLRQGHDNGSVTRDALANALEHYEANLTRIDTALARFEKGGV